MIFMVEDNLTNNTPQGSFQIFAVTEHTRDRHPYSLFENVVSCINWEWTFTKY